MTAGNNGRPGDRARRRSGLRTGPRGHAPRARAGEHDVPARAGGADQRRHFVSWARDTHQPLREMLARRWRLAVGLGVVFAAVSVFIAFRSEDGSARPDGIEFIGAIAWRGIVYGAADGLLLSAFPIVLVFAALRDSRLRRRAGGLIAVGAIAMIASLAMTAVYHAGYSDFRSDKLRRPLTGDLVWSVPTLATLNPIGSPIAHVGLHVGAVVHNYDTDLFLPPH